MNRSVVNVLLGGFGDGATAIAPKTGGEDDEPQGTVTQITAEDVVEMLTESKSVIVVPGYGMVGTRTEKYLLIIRTHLSCLTN
jgi:NAD(P) transhydrogenase subunit beta